MKQSAICGTKVDIVKREHKFEHSGKEVRRVLGTCCLLTIYSSNTDYAQEKRNYEVSNTCRSTAHNSWDHRICSVKNPEKIRLTMRQEVFSSTFCKNLTRLQFDESPHALWRGPNAFGIAIPWMGASIR